jgi:clan AA aspartic protease
MTSGFFTPEGEPAVRLRVQSDSQERGRVEAVIDTGFNGDLTLPPDLIAALALPEATEERVVLGDGTVRMVQLYTASVVFAGQTRRVFVGEAPTTPLLGTELLQGFSLRVDFWEGGSVEIRERPTSP